MIYWDMADETTHRGTLVNVIGTGIFIQGPSGIGKSLSALSLMRSGHRLVADDLVAIARHESLGLVGRAVEENVRIEIRGLGVFFARNLFSDCVLMSSPIDLVVELAKYIPERDAGRIEPLITEIKMLDHPIKKILVPVPNGTDPGLLVELVTRAHMTANAEKK
ncbi:MAG: hypothetical protein V1897_20265 [Pseudomonadota bacterium]